MILNRNGNPLHLKEGRDLDILIAEQIMGWRIETDKGKVKRLSQYGSTDAQGRWWRTPQGGWDNNPPRYSSKLPIAWEVVEMMSHQGQALFLMQSGTEIKAAFTEPSAVSPDYVSGESVMMVICKAALAFSAPIQRAVSVQLQAT